MNNEGKVIKMNINCLIEIYSRFFANFYKIRENLSK